MNWFPQMFGKITVSENSDAISHRALSDYAINIKFDCNLTSNVENWNQFET